jgi:pentatricopeptide repeat protein
VYTITETCRRSNNLDHILEFLGELREGMPIDCSEDDIMPLVSECVDTNNMRCAQRVVSFLTDRNVILTGKLYSLMLKGYGKQNNEAMITKTLHTCYSGRVTPDTVLFNSALDAYIRCGHANIAVQLFDSVILQDVKKNLTEKRSLAVELIHYFKMFNLEPNVRTFNILIKSMRGLKAEDANEMFKRCLDMVQLMRTYGMEPDSVTMNTLVDLSVRVGNLEAAEKIIRVLRSAPGVEGYTSLISGYAAAGDLKNMFRVHASMLANKVQPNAFTLSALMSGCLAANDLPRAKKLLDGVFESLHSDEVTSLHGAYIIGLCKKGLESGEIRTATAAFNELQERGFRADMATVNAYIQALCEVSGDVYGALQVFYGAVKQGLRPDDYTYSILFSGLGRKGYLDEALRLFETSQLQLDTIAINSLLRAFVGGPNPLLAVQFFQRMCITDPTVGEVATLLPNKITFTILFAALLKSTRPSDHAVCAPSAAVSDISYVSDGNRFYEAAVQPSVQPSTVSVPAAYPPLPSSRYEILRVLFSTMRFKYDIAPDEVMVSTLNALFMAITRGPGGEVKYRGAAHILALLLVVAIDFDVIGE